MFDENSLLEKWTQQHGDDPDKWPLPEGQSLTWREWAKGLEAVARSYGWASEEPFCEVTKPEPRFIEAWHMGHLPKDAIYWLMEGIEDAEDAVCPFCGQPVNTANAVCSRHHLVNK